jgi:protein O-GlcNAc transferase
MSDATLQQKLDAAGQLHQAGKLLEAEKIYGEVLAAAPEQPDVLHLLGVVRFQQGQPVEALQLIARAIAIYPRNASYHCNLGVVLSSLGRHATAKSAFREAITLRPDYFEAHFNLANTLRDMGRPDEAIPIYRKSQVLRPDDRDAVSNMLFTLHSLPDADPKEVFREHREWDERFAKPLAGQMRVERDRDLNRRLRIGYVSADFRDHSVGFFMESLLAGHDAGQVELFGYADLPKSDATGARFQKLFHLWRDITGKSDQAVAEMIRNDWIDILVDLAGHTAGNRLLVFARKPAPIQITYLGYPDTTGLSAMDYRITDSYADPPGMTEGFYSEKLLRLPRSFVCYRPPTDAPEVSPPPSLKYGYLTFGSFNNLAKMNQKITDLWIRVLKATPKSRLLIKNGGLTDEETRREFLQRFTSGGIDPSRIDLRPKSATIREHLQTYAEVDIALDTYPYNGTTTTCEALWMGVPVVTLAGKTHASRVGLSLLTNLNFPGLVAETEEQYVEIAADIPALAEMRQTMRDRMKASPLLDGPATAKAMEAEFRRIWSVR